MRDIIYPYLSALLTLSLGLCRGIRSLTFRSDETTLSDSEVLRNKCVKETEKAFMPAVDREDIAYIALRLHRLNTRLYTLGRLTECRGKRLDNTETISILEHTENVCSRLSDILEKRFKGNKRASPLQNMPESFAEAFPTYSDRYNFYSVISDYTLFKAASECAYEAELIFDYTLRTLIKNS